MLAIAALVLLTIAFAGDPKGTLVQVAVMGGMFALISALL